MADDFLKNIGTYALSEAKASAAQTVATTRLGKNASEAEIMKAAVDFEAMFISQMMAPMFEGLEPDENFGGGEAESTWRGMQLNEFAKLASQSGGIGITDAIKAELLRIQEKVNGKDTDEI